MENSEYQSDFEVRSLATQKLVKFKSMFLKFTVVSTLVLMIMIAFSASASSIFDPIRSRSRTQVAKILQVPGTIAFTIGLVFVITFYVVSRIKLNGSINQINESDEILRVKVQIIRDKSTKRTYLVINQNSHQSSYVAYRSEGKIKSSNNTVECAIFPGQNICTFSSNLTTEKLENSWNSIVIYIPDLDIVTSIKNVPILIDSTGYEVEENI